MILPPSFRICLFAVLILLLATTAQAYTPTYITPDVLPPQLLLPPPIEGSKDWQKEITGVLAAQAHITSEARSAIQNEQQLRLELMTKIIGENFARQQFPKTFALLNNVFQDSENIVRADKKFWHTRRPYLTDKRVTLLVDPLDDSPSYPSGHVASMRVIAEVLGLLYPENIQALRQRADDIAQDRVLAGVHYPVDIRGGKTLALLITGALLENQNFQTDLTAAREEIANFH